MSAYPKLYFEVLKTISLGTVPMVLRIILCVEGIRDVGERGHHAYKIDKITSNTMNHFCSY